MKLFKYIIAIFLLLTTFTGCDDELNPGQELPENIELAFSSRDDLYSISIKQCETWEVKSHPQWAAPMQESGSKGEEITLFVEGNTSEEERKGEMVIVTDKNEIIYSLTQRSIITDDDNASEIISDKILLLTYGVGCGINVLATPQAGEKYPYTTAIVNPVYLAKMLASVGEADAWVSEEHYYSHTESMSGTSKTSLATQLSVNAGIEAEISGFSGSLSGKFSNTESTNTETAYAMREIKHIVGSRYLRPGILRSLSVAKMNSVFKTTFNELVEVISKNPEEKDAIHDLLEKFGTHLIVHGTVGGELELAMEMTSTEKNSEMDINAALNVSCGVVGGDAGFAMTDSEKELMKNTKITLTTYGGNLVHTLKPGSTFEDAMKEALDAATLEKWVSAIKNKSSLALVDVQLYPIYDLMPNETVRNAIRKYMINEYQEKKTKNKPLLFAVNGFGDNGVVVGEAYIPELDVKLECYKEMIPEISNDEPSIIIYSGSKDEMNYDRGFFIGSDTKQPGKLSKSREGVWSFESFDLLNTGQVTKLYVNATGDITIAGKTGVNYSAVQFTGITQEELDKNRISESEEIKEPILDLYIKDLFKSQYWHGLYDNSGANKYQTIAAASQSLTDDNIQTFINSGMAMLAFTCATESGLHFNSIGLYDKNQECYDSKTTYLDGQLKIEEIDCLYPLKDETTYAVIRLKMEDGFETTNGWKWTEKPYLHLKVNYDRTPRWRK